MRNLNACVYYNANAYGKGSPPTKIILHENLPLEIFSAIYGNMHVQCIYYREWIS